MKRLTKTIRPILFLDICVMSAVLILEYHYLNRFHFLRIDDVKEYHTYALDFWTKHPLFRIFPREYPPLAVLPFSFALQPPISIDYVRIFAVWMLGLVCLTYLWLAFAASRRKAIIYAVYLVIGTAGTLLERYDLVPMIVTLGALMLAERRRYLWASVLLAIGALLKIYPLFLLPVLLAYQWHMTASAPSAASDADQQVSQDAWMAARRPAKMWMLDSSVPWQERLQEIRRRGIPGFKSLVAFSVVMALGFGVPALVNFHGVVSVFKYDFQRPLQIESTSATLLWLGTFLGFPAHGIITFGSYNLVGPLDTYLKDLSFLALAAGSLLVCWRVMRGKLTLGQGFVACLAVVLATNKVLSPQYFIWILPLLAYVEGFDWLWLAICVVTTIIYPFLYFGPQAIRDMFDQTVAIRNLLLVIAAVRAVRGRPTTQRGWTEQQQSQPEHEEPDLLVKPALLFAHARWLLLRRAPAQKRALEQDLRSL